MPQIILPDKAVIPSKKSRDGGWISETDGGRSTENNGEVMTNPLGGGATKTHGRLGTTSLPQPLTPLVSQAIQPSIDHVNQYIN